MNSDRADIIKVSSIYYNSLTPEERWRRGLFRVWEGIILYEPEPGDVEKVYLAGGSGEEPITGRVVDWTYYLLQATRALDLIAFTRLIALSTLVQDMATLIEIGEQIDEEQFVMPGLLEQAEAALAAHGLERLKPAFANSAEEVSYPVLHLARARIRKREGRDYRKES